MRCSITFSGLQSARGSKARLTRSITSRSGSENWRSMKLAVHVVALVQSDAVLAREAPARFERDLDDLAQLASPLALFHDGLAASDYGRSSRCGLRHAGPLQSLV